MANETVTITAEMRDEVSAPVSRAAASVEKANQRIERSASRSSSGVKRSSRQMVTGTEQAERAHGRLQRAAERATGGVARSWSGLSGKVKSASQKVKDAARRAGEESGEKMSRGLKDRFSKGLVGLAAGLSVGAALRGANELVNAYSELQDATGAAGVVFGEDMQQIIDQSLTAGETLGMTRAQVIDAANTFGTYGKAAGLSGKELAGFSTEMTTLAGDMASFKGTSPEQAIEAIGAAMRGETEPIRAYGVMLDDASMRQEAMRLGIVKSTKEALTPQQKTLAAQALILKQTTDAQGDFMRTQDSAANVQKRLQAATANVSAQLGQVLEPAFTRVRLAALNVLTPFSQFLERVVKAQELMASGALTGDIAKALGLGPGLTAAIDTALQSYNAFKNTLQGGWTDTDGLSGLPRVFGAIAAAINRVRELNINWGALLGGGTLLVVVGIVQKLGGPLTLIGTLIGRLTPMLGMLGGAFRFLLGPVGLIAGLLIAAYTQSEAFRNAINGLLPVIMGLFAQLASGLVPVFTQLVSMLLPMLVGLFNQIVPVLGSVLAAVVPVIGQLLGALVPVLVQLIGSILPPFSSLLQAVVPILGSLLGALLPIIPPVAGIIAVFVQLIAAVLKPIMPLVTMLAGLLTGVLTVALKALSPVIEGVLGVFSGFVSWLSSVLGPMIDRVSGWFRGLGDLIGGAVNGLRDFASNPLGGVQDFLGIPHSGGGVVGYSGGGVAALASGGVLSGYAPGRDTVPAVLSRGEAVLTPELTKMIGPRAIMQANWAASHRKASSGTSSAGAGADARALMGGGGSNVSIHIEYTGTAANPGELRQHIKTAMREVEAERRRRSY